MLPPIKISIASATLLVLAGWQSPAIAMNSVSLPAESSVILKGTVLEVLNASGYTYLNVKTDGTSQWAVIPQSSITSGEKVELLPGTVMHDVDSKALGRTFSSVVFSGGLSGADPDRNKLSTHNGMLSSADELPPVAISGLVAESITSGGYTYVSVEKDGGRKWVAVPEGTFKVGQSVSFLPGMVMTNFKSSSLGRTFDSIVFSDGLIPVKAAPPQATLRTVFHGKQEFALEDISGTVVEVTEAGGYSYVSVEKNGVLIWVAASPSKVAVGDRVAFQPGEVKRNYQSKKLGRVFPILVFSKGLLKK